MPYGPPVGVLIHQKSRADRLWSSYQGAWEAEKNPDILEVFAFGDKPSSPGSRLKVNALYKLPASDYGRRLAVDECGRPIGVGEVIIWVI